MELAFGSGILNRMNPEQFRLLVPATAENFDESGYLAANPDIAEAVKAGTVSSARTHFDAFNATESRPLRVPLPIEWKHRKLHRVRPLLGPDIPHRETLQLIDCLTDALREEFSVIPTNNVSAHEYDPPTLALLERHADGLVLDCGAGQRNTYYANVVNYEIVAYDSTDVLGVAERLPFKDASFDAVVCMNVLEHVKDPFQVARELMRVLKPGGELLCVAPLLQPLHGYPHHYFNMTHQGLLSLFEPMTEKRTEVYGAMHPIWALNWILASYHAGLPHEQRGQFAAMTVAELLASPSALELETIATTLSEAARTELASAHALSARKPN